MQTKPIALWIALIAGSLLSVGCQMPKAGAPPLTTQLAKDDPDTQLEFWHEIGNRPMVSNDDAFHGLLLYLDGEDPSADYAARVNTMKSRKMIRPSFKGAADDAVSRGTLALAIVRAINLKGGMMMTLIGPTERYAVRELQFNGLYPLSSPNQTFTGREYVGIIGRLEDYQRGNPADKPAAKLPGEGSSEK